jgi:hypothetical protein
MSVKSKAPTKTAKSGKAGKATKAAPAPLRGLPVKQLATVRERTYTPQNEPGKLIPFVEFGVAGDKRPLGLFPASARRLVAAMDEAGVERVVAMLRAVAAHQNGNGNGHQAPDANDQKIMMGLNPPMAVR